MSDITGDPVVVGDVTYVGKASGRTVALATATGEVLWNAVEGALGPVLPAGPFDNTEVDRLLRGAFTPAAVVATTSLG